MANGTKEYQQQVASGSNQGPSVDRSGNTVADPTDNVHNLVEFSVKRIDDMREQDTRLWTLIRDGDIRRADDLRDAGTKLNLLAREYEEKLRFAESQRIDAIRDVDVGAVAIASERASQQATVLANQVAGSAETLRALVTSTASQVAAQLQQTSMLFTERIAALEKVQYESQGKTAVVDPIMADMVSSMREMLHVQANKGGQSEGMANLWGIIAGVIGVVIAIVGIGITIIMLVSRK